MKGEENREPATANQSAPDHGLMGSSKKRKGISATQDPTVSYNAVISYSKLKYARDASPLL